MNAQPQQALKGEEKTPGPRQTLGQLRATHAWNAVSAFKQSYSHEDDRKSFVREARHLPIRIRTAGLGHALLFLELKHKGKPGEAVLKAVEGWLTREGGVFTGEVKTAIRNGNSLTLRQATNEALAYLEWLAKLAIAEFGTDEGVSCES